MATAIARRRTAELTRPTPAARWCSRTHAAMPLGRDIEMPPPCRHGFYGGGMVLVRAARRFSTRVLTQDHVECARDRGWLDLPRLLAPERTARGSLLSLPHATRPAAGG